MGKITLPFIVCRICEKKSVDVKNSTANAFVCFIAGIYDWADGKKIAKPMKQIDDTGYH